MLLPQDCPCSGAEHLRVLTLNVWGLPWPLARHRFRRFERIVEHFREQCYDIAGLQEVWRSKTRLPLPTLHLPDTPHDAGLALAGRLAEQATSTVSHFSHATGVDRLKQKGLLVATVGALTVGVTHLQAGRGHDATRGRQVAEMVERLADVQGPVVLMGDFNLYADSEHDRASEAALERAGFVDTATEAAPTYVARNPYTSSRSAGQRFDRILVRGGAGIELDPVRGEILPRVLSDHQPVLATLRIRRTI